MIDFYLATLLKFLFKLGMASQTLPLTGVNLSQQPGNYDLSEMTFSNYKNTDTGNTLI